METIVNADILIGVDAKKEKYSQLAPSLEPVDPFHNVVLVADLVALITGPSKPLLVLKRSHRTGVGYRKLDKSSNISLRRRRKISKGLNKRDTFYCVMMLELFEK